MDTERPTDRLTESDVVMCGVGILMERYRCDSFEAGTMIVEWARDVAVGPDEVAQWLMEDTITRARTGEGRPAAGSR